MTALAARRDWRLAGFAITCVLVLAGGLGRAALTPVHAPPAPQDELRRHFDAAVLLLHARRFEEAEVLLRRTAELAPTLPEAHTNLGFALLGRGQPAQARAAFEQALALRAGQANAYYGLALAHESLGDLELALGAMRSYLHLGRGESEEHLRRARAALWEWEEALAARRGGGASFPIPGNGSRSWGRDAR